MFTRIASKFHQQARVGIDQGWYKYIGDNGVFVAMTGYGTSAPANTCFERFGITAQATIEAAKKSIAK